MEALDFEREHGGIGFFKWDHLLCMGALDFSKGCITFLGWEQRNT